MTGDETLAAIIVVLVILALVALFVFLLYSIGMMAYGYFTKSDSNPNVIPA